MILLRSLLVLSSFFLAPPVASSAASAPLVDLIHAADGRDLGRDPVWLKLLHYDRSGERSEILSPEFFLSSQGKSDPRAELTATLDAYFQPWGRDTEQHARCRFPARYYWLAQHLALPDYRLREPRCRRLERWALFDRVQSISVLLVSGYFGNPASMFGHAFLKLNTDAPDAGVEFFDLTVNFGALVPENESTIMYISRGLFGGYEAGFSDKYFYSQDLVYSRTELRDIWNYKLGLSDSARILLVLHIWEIVGKKFIYYFLTKNCAYRIAELLELATGETFLDNARAWYVPIEMFHRLSEIDERQADAESPRLIESVQFIPSNQRVLYHQFAQLASEESKVANDIISGGIAASKARLARFEADQKGRILDAVVTYYQYRLIAEQPRPSPQLREAKDRALLARLQLPPGSGVPHELPVLPSPAKGAHPMLTTIGWARGENRNHYLRLRWSPFAHELVASNGIQGDELVVLDIVLGLDGEQGAFFDEANLVRVRKLNTVDSSVVGESRLSWEFNVGARRTVREGERDTDGFVSLGGGRAWKWNDALTLYAMTNLAGHALSPHTRVRPHLGLVGATGTWRASLSLGVENTENDASHWTQISRGTIQYQASKSRALRAEFSNEAAMRMALSVVWYW